MPIEWDSNIQKRFSNIDQDKGTEILLINKPKKNKINPFTIGNDVFEEGYIAEGILLPAEVKEYKGGNRQEHKEKEEHPFVLFKHFESFEDKMEEIIDIYACDHDTTINGKKLKFHPFNFLQNPIKIETAKMIVENELEAETLNMSQLCNEIRDLIRYNIDMDEMASTVLALGIVGTYIHQIFDAYPYFWINGIKGTGKSRLLELINALSYHSIIGADFSAPAIFRFVDKQHATICFDEVERLQHKDSEENARKLALLNCGYRSSGMVHLVEKMGDDLVPRSFNAYSPKFLASINPLGGVLESRCIQIILLRTLKDDYDNRYIDRKKCAELVQKLYIFKFNEAMRYYDQSREYVEPSDKMNLKNREWELFKPIILLCKELMPKWLDDVVKFIDEQKILASDDYESADIIVLLELDEILKEEKFKERNVMIPSREYIPYSEIRNRIIEKRTDMKKWFKNKTLGNALKRLGFAGLKRRMADGFEVKLDDKLIEDDKKRYGLI